MTLGEVLELPPGTKDNKSWINGEFDAFVSNIQPRPFGQGRTMWKAVLTDPDNANIRAEITFFTNPLKFQNCVCHFSGQGMHRGEYNGTPQIEIGTKTLVQPIGPAQNPPPPPQQQQGRHGFGGYQRNTQNSRNDRPPAQQQQRQAPQGQQQQGQTRIPLPGPMVGAAIGQAIGILRHEFELKIDDRRSEDWHAYVFSPDFSRDVHTLASDLIRVNRFLEADQSHLAPKPADRAKDPLADDGRQPDSTDQGYQPDPNDQEQQHEQAPAPQQQPRKPQPGPDGSAFPTDGLDEDVPF